MKRIRVYIAGPISLGDQQENVRRACRTWRTLWQLGYQPFCPHWSYFHNMLYPETWGSWMEFDEDYVRRWADVILRLDGESKGADLEVAWAMDCGIPVVHTIDEITARFPCA